MLIFNSCTPNKKNTITFSIPKDKFIFTVESVEANIITLGLKNNSEDSLSFSTPAHWASAGSILYLNGKVVYEKIKVKANLSARKELVHLKPQEKIIVTYDYALDEIYSSLSPGNYELQFEYFGDIIGGGKQYIFLDNTILKSNKFSIKI